MLQQEKVGEPDEVLHREALARKVVEQWVPLQKRLEELLSEADRAESFQYRLPWYLTRLFDYLREIAKNKSDDQSFKVLMKDWVDLDTKYGDLDDRSGRLEVREWRERRRALNKLLEDLGMGTTRARQRRNLAQVLPAAFYYECPDDCPNLVKLRKKLERVR